MDQIRQTSYKWEHVLVVIITFIVDEIIMASLKLHFNVATMYLSSHACTQKW